MSGLQGGMFSTAAFTVILISNHNPGDFLSLECTLKLYQIG